jgi:hypothetical protein
VLELVTGGCTLGVMSDQDHVDVALRFTNTEDGQECRPAYHTFDDFLPDHIALQQTDMYTHWLSAPDFATVLDAVNDDLRWHRSIQKASSLLVVFGTLAAVAIAVFSIPAGAGLQLLVLFIHLFVSRWLRGRCEAVVNDMFAKDVNPSISERGVALRISIVSGGLFATPWCHLEFTKCDNYESARRFALLRAAEVFTLVPIEFAEHVSPQTPRSPAGEDDDAFSSVVMGRPIAEDFGHRHRSAKRATLTLST